MVIIYIYKLRNFIILMLPILILFDSYCLFCINTFPITLSFLGICIVFLLSLFNFRIKIKDLFYLLLLSFLFIVSFVTYRASYTSFFLYIFFFGTFFISKHNYDKNKWLIVFSIMTILINFFAIISILQMLSNFIDIPRIDVIVFGHMVEGFNRTNKVYFGSINFYRSNGIYLEPSFLSQFSALGIILSMYLYKNKIIDKLRLLISIFLNIAALICSVAGTGVIILGICLLVYLFNKKYRLYHVFFMLFAVLILIIFLYFVPNISVYLYTRLLEIFNPNMSGGLRFTYPYIIMIKTWAMNIFGFGPSNETVAIDMFYPSMLELQSTVASGYAKIGIEFGIFGLYILIDCIIKCKNKEFIYVYVFLILMNFVGGSILQPCFWCLMIFFNTSNKMSV